MINCNYKGCQHNLKVKYIYGVMKALEWTDEHS